MVTIRQATEKDARFLYEVQRDAMQPVSVVSHPKGFDDDVAYTEYLTKFVPEEIQVIQLV